MARVIQPGRFPAGEVPNVMNLVPDAAATFSKGHIVRKKSGASTAEKHPLGATVTGIYGVALEDVVAGNPDGVAPECAIAKADRNTVFIGQVTASGAILTDLSSILIGVQYGLLEVAGTQYVDKDDVTHVVVQIVDTDENLNIAYFKFIESALQEP
jgi:hypothetical protein